VTEKKEKAMKRAALVLISVLAVPAGLLAQSKVDQRRPATADGQVSIENMAGTIKVIGWEKAEVWVTGTLARDAELDLGGSEGRTKCQVEVQGNPMSARSDLEVHVPAGSHVKIEAFQSEIGVTGVTGGVDAETVNGAITMTGAAKEVNLQSVNGAVSVSKAGGRIHAEAVNGAVTVSDASGHLEASTVNGKLLVTGGTFDRAALESVSGGVQFEGSLSKQGTLSVETVSGAAELVLPAAIGADFTLSTFSGDIVNELGPQAAKKGHFTPQKELSFTAGGGGAQITVETLSGTITIKKRP
jgi:DUF4097 and DUF4098 domain-containing protein YvlB